MSRMQFGEKMPSSFLEIFKPTPNISHRFAILDINMLVASSAHWVDTPAGTKGMYACTKGACCSSGLFKDGPTNYYALPMWLYLDPPNPQTGAPGSSEGVLKVFRMPAGLYDMVVTLAQQIDLMNVDLLAIAQPAGKGVKTSLFPVQDGTLLPAEYRAQIVQQLGDLYPQLERALEKPCSEMEWQQILAEYAYGSVGTRQPQQQPGVVHRANPVALFAGQGQQAIAAPAQAAPVRQAPAMPGAAVRQPAPQPAAPAPKPPVAMPKPMGTAPKMPSMPGRPMPAPVQQPVVEDAVVMSDDEMNSMLGDVQ